MIAYNEADALSGLFKDISLQDYPHNKIEVVFVDSMSTDKTYEMMENSKKPVTDSAIFPLYSV